MREAILRTIAYFDIFDYPLTSFEVWKWLRSRTPYSYGEVAVALRDPSLAPHLEHANGFWFLRGRHETIATRLARYMIAERKYKRVMRAVRLLRFVPTIRMIAICNTLAWSHSREDADIDFFVVTEPGALWLTRLLAVLPFALLGLRPQTHRGRDLFCFSFFASERALDFAAIRLEPDDPYLLYWVASLVPVYDPDGLLEAVWDANPWIGEELPHARPVAPGIHRRVRGRVTVHEHTAPAPGLGEALARALQLLRFPAELRMIMNTDERVIVTDELLKFHENDRRIEFRGEYETRCRALGV